MDNDQQFITKQFKNAGYKTLMSEDWAWGVFALNGIMCASFSDPPTDHYMKPFQLRVEGDFFSDWNTKQKNGELYKALYRQVCKEPHNYIMDYLKQFIDAYEDQPKFSLSWMSYPAHSFQDGMYHVDDLMYRFLRDNREKLKNSYIFLMGDHGPRFGKLRDTKIGEFEDNNPGLFVALPENMRSNKNLMWTLRQNSKELISHYDLYATFVDIVRRVDPKQAKNKLILHGSSFLKPLPQPRNCGALRIPFEYCQCEFKKVPRKDRRLFTRSIVNFMVYTLNEEIRRHNYTALCETLKLDHKEEVEVEEIEPESGLGIYKVTVQVLPSGGRFWGYFHVTYDQQGGKPTFELISETMPRLNAYGGQECVDLNPIIAPYCYCKDQKTRFGGRVNKFEYANITTNEVFQ